MEHKYPRVLIACFLGALVALGGLFFLLPDREFSEAENRVLAQFPAFSLKAVFEEGWTSRFETYAADQFPFRDGWVGAKAGSQFALGFRENNGVYFGDDGTLIQDYRGPGRTGTNAKALQKFMETSAIPVTFALIPDSIAVNADLLPPLALAPDQLAAIESAYAIAPGVDLLRALSSVEVPFYRTDHHWTSAGAYAAYTELAPALGFDPLPEDAFTKTVLTDDFRGTLAMKSGAFWIPGEEIVGYVPNNTPNAATEIYENNALALSFPGYHALGRLDTQDGYAVFLDGNHALTIVKTGLSNGRKLLLIKDSFSHALAPILAAHYEEIHLVDLRYYRPNFPAYIVEQGISEALVLYSVNNFSEDANLVFLRG